MISNPIYPKKRQPTFGFSVGDRVKTLRAISMAHDHDIPSGARGRVVSRSAPISDTGEVRATGVGENIYGVQFDHIAESPVPIDVFESEIVNEGFQQNPIYPKKRSVSGEWPPIVGDQVIMASGHAVHMSGTVQKIYNDGRSMIVKMTDGRIFSVRTVDAVIAHREYGQNPVYPKGRGEGWHAGDRVLIVGDVTGQGEKGTIQEVSPEIGMIPAQGYVIVKLDSGSKGYFSIRSLKKIGYDENPIYPKKRERGPRFNYNDIVKVIAPRSTFFNWTGRVIEINPLTSGNHQYRIDLGEPWGYYKVLEQHLDRADRTTVGPPIPPKFNIKDWVYKTGDRWLTYPGQIQKIEWNGEIFKYTINFHIPKHLWQTKTGPSIDTAKFDEDELSPAVRKFDSNPIYPKQRHPNPKFTLGQRVMVSNARSHPEFLMHVGEVMERRDYPTHYAYRVRLLGRFAYEVLWFLEDELEKAPSFLENPIFPKRRSQGSNIKIGDQVTIVNGEAAGLSGKVEDIYNRVAGIYLTLNMGDWRIDVKATDVVRTSRRHEPNPVYDKHRGEFKFKMGDPVVITQHATDPDFSGDAGTIIERRRSFVEKAQMILRVYKVRLDQPRKGIGKTWVREQHLELDTSRYLENPSGHRWGAWPAEHPDVGEVVIDSHPKAATHGRTAVIKDRRSFGYLLKFKDGTEAWRTPLQIRRMPGKLGWRSMQENPIYSKHRPGPKKFKIGNIVHFTDPETIWNGVGTITRVHTLRKDVNRYDIEVKPGKTFYGVDEKGIEFLYDENPIYDKKRPTRGELRHKLLSGQIFFSYLPRTGQTKMWEKGAGIEANFAGFRLLHTWDDTPGDLGVNLSYMMRARTPEARESVVDKVIELLQKELPPGRVNFDTDSIFPKRRPKVASSSAGSPLYLALRHIHESYDDSPEENLSNAANNAYAIMNDERMSTDVFYRSLKRILENLKKLYKERHLPPLIMNAYREVWKEYIRFYPRMERPPRLRFQGTENPIYEKKRPKPKLEVGDRALVIEVNSHHQEDAELRQRIGTSGVVEKRRAVVGSWIYEVRFHSGFVGSFYDDELVKVPDNA